MENWNFESAKSVDGGENLSTAEREEAVMEQHAEPTPEPQQEESQGYQTPTNDDGDFVVNLDNPIITEDAVQERETTEVPVEPEAGDSQEVEQEVRVEPEQEASQSTSDADFGIELVQDDEEAEAVTPEPAVHNQGIEEPQQPQIELPEGVDKLVEFMNETGGTVEDYLALNRDYSQMDNLDVLAEYYRQTKPHFDNDDIQFHMNRQFYYDQEVADQQEVRAKQLAFKEELYKAQQFLESNKQKYYQDLKLNRVPAEARQAMEYYNQQQEAEKNQQQMAKVFQDKTKEIFNDEFKGFDFKVGENKYRVKIGDVGKTREFQSDINNFLNQFVNDQGEITNFKEYHKAMYVAQNADKLAQHFYEQGRADAIKQSAASAKNIDMKPRQDAASVVTPSGNKFRVVSGDSSNSLRIKMRK